MDLLFHKAIIVLIIIVIRLREGLKNFSRRRKICSNKDTIKAIIMSIIMIRKKNPKDISSLM
jgi:hypothetical protein